MEINEKYITYREYKDVKVPILKIKKGTLLFRYVYDIPQDKKTIKSMLEGSFLGIKIDKESFCLPNQYNVFFYPYPYIMDTNKYLSIFKPKESHMVLFETTKDLNVALFLLPSEMNRIGKNEENEILITCDNYSYCNGLKGFYFDACFRDDFLKNNMDIMGYYGISENDSKRFMTQYKKSFFTPFRKFIHLHKDTKTIGVPELVLYPRTIREIDSINTEIKEDSIYEYILENQNIFNYKTVDEFKHKPFDKNDKLFYYLNRDFKKNYKFNKLNGFYEKI
jgi:hypothetical protein